ncbi:hypothetical protein [Paenibacillus herberti]|uniref:Uncharacterized protein n=1 Tax=Paenibacillus herberti TaxID=1619309 RepID=A0A229P026_9BACL|nr:hypothetical protein [Paenibacillus herberti]OXM15448.1 hypothetical protein CGZ75_01525 [Paenibacillus herberti]
MTKQFEQFKAAAADFKARQARYETQADEIRREIAKAKRTYAEMTEADVAGKAAYTTTQFTAARQKLSTLEGELAAVHDRSNQLQERRGTELAPLLSEVRRGRVDVEQRIREQIKELIEQGQPFVKQLFELATQAANLRHEAIRDVYDQREAVRIAGESEMSRLSIENSNVPDDIHFFDPQELIESYRTGEMPERFRDVSAAEPTSVNS